MLGMKCNRSAFTEESQQKLQAEFAANPTALLFGWCECGARVFARSKAGVWVPDSHDKPTTYRPSKGSNTKRVVGKSLRVRGAHKYRVRKKAAKKPARKRGYKR
jgi:hypothetical protein